MMMLRITHVSICLLALLWIAYDVGHHNGTITGIESMEKVLLEETLSISKMYQKRYKGCK